MTEGEALAAITREKVIMVVRAPDPAAAEAAIEAAVAGGVRAVEVTFTVPGAVEVIRNLSGDSRLIVGAGTVLNIEQAESALDAGAQFLVSPGLDVGVVEHVREAGVLMLPGVFTPTEVMRALELGAPAVKLFPADLARPAYVRALRGPLPDVKIIPSGGINADNAAEWLATGAIAVGLAGSLSPATVDPDRESITAEARRVMAAVGITQHPCTEGVVL
ncbi:bifunctional 4-hydroxy-2-oxoglutarate aldolase/2-dehydro-3-deoxy-phosphogluconate aldolase [Microbacterium jiangjiandongii]|uniref:bifunctional 4-hydroxy-2-oxoglutarate aldolase/2-dehydro-3-deoxy-phosphogluconate aldolase n=1 Tax=Microbacterium jiangjiandongii TaxID=3049071 RepID=UPI00214BDC7E|nr:bifunctional 4-hydroxy-2-oxoglutarate aldolase/2-dehydro-3-deoxy-phosphogluconate aldolase [Microbacterium sp. zg.Y843]MCR2815013.1 bifunctional 4-hydroxy-2-oxoglutarate aldolase/2-dehydro-3-deoxy-phosphogluconate aldolase [Microbacterium sp. zg.Y843]